MDIDNTPQYIALGINRQSGKLAVRAYHRKDILDTYQDTCSSSIAATWENRTDILQGITAGFPLIRLTPEQQSEATKQYHDLMAIYDAMADFKTRTQRKEIADHE